MKEINAEGGHKGRDVDFVPRAGDDSGSQARNLVSAKVDVVTGPTDSSLAALKTGEGINYDGESGPVAFDSNGDITTANFIVVTYGADNRAVLSGREAAGRAAG